MKGTLCKRHRWALGVFGGVALLTTLLLPGAAPLHADSGDGECAFGGPPEYYKIDLVPTGKIPGTRRAQGVGYVSFSRSPFGIAISAGGHYVYDLSISFDHLAPPKQGVYAVWITTPNLDQITPLGALDAQMRATGRVDWNKFLVVVTLEPSAEALGATWTGPVVFRGMSRSGLMHTMAGHGPFQQEPCATFGYN